MEFKFGLRRAKYHDISNEIKSSGGPLSQKELEHFETYDLIYRSLCAVLYNYVPMSGHPGGSISSGRYVAGILFNTLDYDVSDPNREDADIISYTAGHKALGLYAMWALRNEVIRKTMLRETGVSACTRLHFGKELEGGKNRYLRFAYSGIDTDQIEEGIGKLKDWAEG